MLEGLFEGPWRSEPLRARLRRSAARHGAGWLSRVLDQLDPTAAARIHANDTPKLIRAIEVSLEARRPITEAWSAGAEPLTGYRVLRIGLAPERKALYARIDARARAMFERGLVDEGRRLMAKYGAERRIFDALGYRQAKLLLAGELTEAQAIEAAQRGHRNYAKRQLTWFRREPEVRWLAGFGNEAEVQQVAIEAVVDSAQKP
jgi:tRNA dimethylallyltransferase